MSDPDEAAAIRWGTDGLVPVVAVDAGNGDVLMVASMNAEALARTLESGDVHYWSRSRGMLWRKGETSGHEQRLVEIRVNCNRDSLLLRVEQRGAVCHDGYPSCYYRRLAPDGSLEVVRERVFDPADVYRATGVARDHRHPAPSNAADPIDLWYGAFLALQKEDLTAASGTSRLLRDPDDRVSGRLADELLELAGVLDGTHRHGTFVDDVALEAMQCLYWAAVVAIRAGFDRDRFRSLETCVDNGDMSLTPSLPTGLRTLAAGVRPGDAFAQLAPSILSLIAAAAGSVGLTLTDLVRRDTAEMRTRPHLAPYFARADNA